MFFLVRSAVCIGLVVSALPDSPAQRIAAQDQTTAVAPVAAAAMARLCREHPASCARVLQGALDAGALDASVGPTPEVPGPPHRRIPKGARVL